MSALSHTRHCFRRAFCRWLAALPTDDSANAATGRYGTQLGVTDWITEDEEAAGLGLPVEAVTWPGVLQRAGWKHEGVDFSPLLRGEPMPPRETTFARYDLRHRGSARMRSARPERWKLVRHFEGDQLDELYDLAADPGEERNLIPNSSSTPKLNAEQNSARADLDAKLQTWMRSIHDPLTAQ